MCNPSIQSRLQQRIAFRAEEINDLVEQRADAKFLKNYQDYRFLKLLLKSVERSQKLDKELLSSICWVRT